VGADVFAAADVCATTSARHHDAICQRVAALADITCTAATTTTDLVVPVCGSRATAVEPATTILTAGSANHNDQRLAWRDRDGCAHFPAVSTARRAHSFCVDARRTRWNLELLWVTGV
jgi:hypothetical protein